METTSVHDSLPQTRPTALPQSTPLDKPHAVDVALPTVDDHCQPANPRHRAKSLGALSTRHGWRRFRVAAGGVVALAALVIGVHYYLTTHDRNVTEAA